MELELSHACIAHPKPTSYQPILHHGMARHGLIDAQRRKRIKNQEGSTWKWKEGRISTTLPKKGSRLAGLVGDNKIQQI